MHSFHCAMQCGFFTAKFAWQMKAYCILRKRRKLAVNAQYMRKICIRFSHNAQYMRKICARCTYFPNAQYMHKIVLISPMRNIFARFAQDCTYFPYFPNAQYVCKICARLYLFLQCAIYAQDLCKIVLISSMRNICARFALTSPMRNICARFSHNAEYMRKICARLYLFPQCAIYAQDCTYFHNAQYMRKIALLLSLEILRFNCTSVTRRL